MARFKIDENLPLEVADALRRFGHDAATVQDEGLVGARDALLYSRCQAEGRSLLTLDVGFGDIRAYDPAHSPGIAVLRLKRQDKASILNAVQNLVVVLASAQIGRALWIVDESRIRVRTS